MPGRRVWTYNPHSGGKTVPDHVRGSTEVGLRAFAAQHFAGSYRELAVRFRGHFCYIDAFVEPDPLPPGTSGPGDETDEEYQKRLGETPVHLCRLRFLGDRDRWSFAFYSCASDRYEPSVFLSGDAMGTPEEAFDLAAGVYLT